MAKSRITFPDGTEVEISKDTSPEQITAIINALKNNVETPAPKEIDQGEVIIAKPSAEEIWENGSKKEKLALFVRNHFMPDQLFSTIDVRDQQLQFVKRMVFGESPAIGTYLNRLHDDNFLVKIKRGNRVRYQLTDKIINEYPTVGLDEMSAYMQQVE